MRGSTAGLKVSLKGESQAHYALLTILDSVFAIFILSPCVVGYWRGVWECMSVYVFPEEPYLSALISVGIGFGGHFLAAVFQYDFERWFNPDKKRLTYLCASRFYTIGYGFTCVNSWRGVWLLLDEYTDPELGTVLTTTLVSVAALALMRCLRNVVAPPLTIVIDCAKGYFEVPTMFRMPSSQKNTPIFFLDCLFSVFVIGTLVVFVWRGAWVLFDMYLFPDDEPTSAFGSLILGYTIAITAFLLQPLMRWLCSKTSGVLRIIIADIYLLFSFIGTVNVWRGIWNILNLYYLPDEPELSCWSTHIVFLVLLILLKCSNSVLVRGVYIDAEEPGGKCVIFPCYYLRLYFQNERAKKYGRSGAQNENLLSPAKNGKQQIDCDFTKPHLCACHINSDNNSSVTNHITVSIPLVHSIKEFGPDEGDNDV